MCNFHSPEVVVRGSEAQLQVGEKLIYLSARHHLKLINLNLNIYHRFKD